MVNGSDRVRAVLVVVFAVTQVLASPLTSLAFDTADSQGAISDANLSPVTPAGYAFSIWALIYAASLVLAIYQILPGQLGREVHRRTGWWLAGAFASSTLWVPVFGLRQIWVAQLILVMLVICLIFATIGFSRSARRRAPPSSSPSGCRSPSTWAGPPWPAAPGSARRSARSACPRRPAGPVTSGSPSS